MLSALDHPNICRIYDYAEGPECDFLVLELIEGTTLQRAIDEGMSRGRKLRIARDVAGALAAAHRRGIVHRDLKPDNIMIAADGTVKVLDFGIARAGGHVQLAPQESDDDLDVADTWIFAAAEAATTVAGTPLYMSPEQARGATITTASDLFSFGLLLQMLLTGEEPRRVDAGTDELLRLAAAGETLPMRNQPADVTALVARLKSFAPAERPTAVETIERLERILTAPARRFRIVAAAVVAALFLGGVAKYTIDVRQANTNAERRRDQAERWSHSSSTTSRDGSSRSAASTCSTARRTKRSSTLPRCGRWRVCLSRPCMTDHRRCDPASPARKSSNRQMWDRPDGSELRSACRGRA